MSEEIVAMSASLSSGKLSCVSQVCIYVISIFSILLPFLDLTNVSRVNSLDMGLLKSVGKSEVCEKSLTFFFLLPFNAVHFLGLLLEKFSYSAGRWLETTAGSWLCPVTQHFLWRQVSLEC